MKVNGWDQVAALQMCGSGMPLRAAEKVAKVLYFPLEWVLELSCRPDQCIPSPAGQIFVKKQVDLFCFYHNRWKAEWTGRTAEHEAGKKQKPLRIQGMQGSL